jgi:hypothetical protein
MEWFEFVVLVVAASSMPVLIIGYPVDVGRIISDSLDIILGDVK